ncbi:MAG: hypothetical protein P8R43_01915 [Planctomycetota bacterium]|nr:hypothetical protein [Planctomycetota bacterium]
MITLALSTVLCCAAQAVDVAARLELAPGATAATGQPLEWTVTVSGLDSDGAVLAAPPDFGPEWVVLGGPTPVVNSDLALASRPGLELRWQLMGLAAGELETPEVRFQIGDQDPFGVAPVSIELAGALGGAEDAPRPLAGFRDVEDAAGGDADLALVAVALLMLAACLPLVSRARRGRAGATAPVDREANLLERIEALDPAADPAAVMGALGPLLRRAVDDARSDDQRSLTDSEWAASLEGSPGVTPERSASLSALIEELGRVRYGGVRPSSFAAREAVTQALDHIRALSGASQAQAGGGA